MKLKIEELNTGYEGRTKIVRFSARPLVIIAAVLVAVFLFVYILSSFGIIPVDAAKARLVSTITQDGENYPITINSGSTIKADVIGDSLYILTTNDISVYTPRGNLKYSQPHSFASPSISVTGDKAIIYDRGDTGFMLVNESRYVYSGYTDKKIYCAEYGEGGNYALATEGTNSTSLFSVYDKRHNLIFSWECDYEHVVSIALSKDCNFAGVAVISAENGEIFTTVNYFGFDYSDVLNSQMLKGSTAFGLEFTAYNTLTLFTDSGVYSIKREAQEPEEVSGYYSSEFISYDINSKGEFMVALARYGSVNEINLIAYSKNGKEKCNVSCNQSVEKVAFSDKYIFTLAENTIMVYNLRGKQVSKITVEGDAYGFIPNDSYIHLISLDKISRCYSYGDSTVKVTL